jgi:shikimate 5-dehydrogenase
MLIAQAQEQSEWWVGHRPAARLMRESALAILNQPEETA